MEDEAQSIQQIGSTKKLNADTTFFNPPSFFSSKRVATSAGRKEFRDDQQQLQQLVAQQVHSEVFRTQPVPRDNSGQRKKTGVFRVVNRRASASPTTNKHNTQQDTNSTDESTLEFQVYKIRDLQPNSKQVPEHTETLVDFKSEIDVFREKEKTVRSQLKQMLNNFLTKEKQGKQQETDLQTKRRRTSSNKLKGSSRRASKRRSQKLD